MIVGKLLFSSLQTEAVSLGSKYLEVTSASAPDPKSRAKSSHFIAHLEAQAQIMLASAAALRDELTASVPRFTLLTSKLTSNCAQSKSLDGKLTEALCRTLITPIDCEDLKRLSHVIHKLTATQLRLARTFDTATGAASAYGPLQDLIVKCAGSLDSAIGALKGSQLHTHCHSLHANWRQARTNLRGVHTGDWANDREIRHVLSAQLLYVEFAAELGYIKAAYDTLMRTRLKNG